MRTELRQKLGQALSKIDRPSTFCVSGSAPAVLPGLEVEGLGPVGLPLTAKQAKELKRHCHQAPYGKGEQTLVDTSVRRVWRMEPGRFSLTNPDWDRFIAETVKKVQEELGLEEQKLESHLYDLLLYEPGSFFLPHRDGEKLDRMVATLVVVLPSAYEGGELVVRHDGQEKVIDLGGPDAGPFQVHYAAFYADCEHEVRPLRKGYRLCLVYNLTLAKKTKKSISAPRASVHIERIVPLLREWAADDSARKLVITLDHQYTRDGLTWDALKGEDRARAQVLLEAARQAGCEAHLALLTFRESGSAEGNDGYGYGVRTRRRWYSDDDDEEDDAGRYEMGEVFDTSLTATHFSDSEGNTLPIREMRVEEDEVLDRDALKDVNPEEEYEGYTGNEGMTLDRWYRHAAIFLWSKRRHFEIICDRDSRDVVPVLARIVTRWRQSKRKGADAAALKAQCLDFATAILAKWPENEHARTDPEEPKTGDLLKTLADLGEPGLIRTFLGDVMIKDAAVDPGTSLVALCQQRGWGTFQKELRTVTSRTTYETMERNVRLLEQIGAVKPRKKEGWDELCSVLAKDLVSAIEAVDRKPSPPEWSSRKVDRAEVLAGLARSLILTGQGELLSRVVDHALASPRKYPLEHAHVPALISLRPWLKKNLKMPSAALTRWVASCREQLESLTARMPQEPKDFRRAARITCRCTECAELKQFLEDPRESVHRFRVNEGRRNHLAQEIRKHRCDLNVTTERKGSPYTLVCTKNTASYQDRLKKYHADQERLATIRAIEACLPG